MLDVTALVFDGRKTAQKALDTAADEAPEARYWVDDVAVVSRGKRGHVRVSSTWAQNMDETAAGAGLGALTGGLVGALFGPAGAAAGALGGGALFGLAGVGVDVALEDPRLSELGERLEDDTSALVLVAEQPTAADFVSVFEPYQATVIGTELNEHDVKALREALKAERVRSGAS